MKLKNFILPIFAVFSFIFINIVPVVEPLIVSGILILAYIICAFFSRKSFISYTEKSLDFRYDIPIKIFSGFMSLFFAIRFFTLWIMSEKLQKFSFAGSAVKTLAVCFASLVFLCGTYIAFSNLFSFVRDIIKKLDYDVKPDLNYKKTGYKSIVIIAVTTLFFVTLCSKSSPIYPFNNWNDANCFFTVGKAAANNIVLYKDIFEQKGPLLYFMHSLAYLISPDTFTGVYLLELINGFLLLFILYKTVLIFTEKDSVLIIPLLAVVIYTSGAFYMGDSAEEFCLPCLAICNYYGIRALYLDKKLRPAEWFITGLTACFVLWFKFSLLGFYIGFGIFFAIVYIKNKWIKEAFVSLASLAGGIAALSVPVLIYFVINKAVKDLFEVYFYDNLFLYTTDTPYNKLFTLFYNLYYGIHSFLTAYPVGLALIITGLVYLSFKNKKVFFFNLCTFISSLFFIYSGGRHYIYYPLILSYYIPFGLIPVYSIFKKYAPSVLSKSKRKKLLAFSSAAVYSVICVAAAFLLSSNTYMLKYSKDDMPQYKFAKIMSQTENPTMFEYMHLDGGFYTASGIVPSCKYFCGLNIPYDELREMQKSYIANGVTDYVVVRKDKLEGSQLDVYELIASEKFESSKGKFDTYYLYKRK